MRALLVAEHRQRITHGRGPGSAASGPLGASLTALIEGQKSDADQDKADRRRNRDEVTLLNIQGMSPPPCRAEFAPPIQWGLNPKVGSTSLVSCGCSMDSRRAGLGEPHTSPTLMPHPPALGDGVVTTVFEAAFNGSRSVARLLERPRAAGGNLCRGPPAFLLGRTVPRLLGVGSAEYESAGRG